MKGAPRSTSTILRLSGVIFTVIGGFHVLRYFELVRGFDFTSKGSLLIGIFLLVLAAACFVHSRN